MQTTIYTPESPVRHPLRLLRAMGRDLLASRELAWRLFVRDFSSQYRQSALGYFWAIAPPIVTTLPWLFLSSQNILDAGETPIPYPAFVLAGTTLWTAFTDATMLPLSSLMAGRPMLAKINFPREALILGSLGQLTLNLLIRILVMLAMFAVLRVPFITPQLLLAPVGLIAIIVAGMCLGLVVSPLGMLYTDVGRALGFLLGFWMILTPVVYMPPQEGFAGHLARWNPASPLITTTRDWFTGQLPSQLDAFLVVVLVSLGLLIVGWVLVRLTLPMIVERMGG